MFRFLALVAVLLPAPLTAQLDPDLLSGLRARSIGPAGMSGRIGAICGVPGDPLVLYVGAATGGLWKTTDGGLSFEPLFDEERVASIGAVTVHPRSTEVVWVGTGEGHLRNSSSVGNGVYRSLDGGRTFEHLGLTETEHIERIVVHPDDPDVAWVAALGRAWGENDERGVFRTEDGGATWERVLFVDGRTGCASLAIDPRNPDKLFAALWDYRREPFFFRSGGPGSGLWITRDGGDNWTELDDTDGLPKGELGRIGVAIAPSDPRVVYALVEAKKSVLLRSDDGGASFREVNDDDGIAPRPFYYARIWVDPEDPDRLYNLHSIVTVSDDGGKSFETLIPWKIHPDHHAFWIDPHDPRRLVDGNDGGLAISADHGRSWRFVENLPLAQFYHVQVDDQVPYHVLGGMQDNGSWRGPSEVWENGGIRNHHWQEVGFGDGFDTVPDPGDPTQGYAMSQGGYLMRWNAVTGERKSIRPPAPEPTEADGEEAEEIELRFNWNTAIAIDPFDSNVVYYGSQFVHRSPDRGETWTILSPDLTTNEPDWQRQDESGGLTLDVTGAENYTTILTIAPSPLVEGLLWVGTDDGRLHVTRDGGATWTSVERNLPGVPWNTWIPHVEVSKHDPAVAYVVLDDHRRSNWEPYVYRTEDHGASWQSLVTPGIWGYCLVIEEDPVDPNLLFLGTEFGLYVSVDRGGSWLRFENGFPTVAVRDLVVHPREHDLVIGTHGRAAWIVDDVSPLRGLTAEALDEPLALFDAADAIQYRRRQVDGMRFPGDAEFRGENASYGAAITFSVAGDDFPHPDPDVEAERRRARKEARAAEKEKEKGKAEEPAEEPGDSEQAKGPEGSEPPETKGKKEKEKEKEEKPTLEIEITDADGEVVQTLEPEAQLGLNRVHWNLRREGPRRPSFDAAPRGRRRGRGGAYAPPGTYRATIRYGELEVSDTFEVLPDPRSPHSPEGRQAALAASLRVEAVLEGLADAADRVRDLRADLDVIAGRVERERKALEDDDDEGDEGDGDETEDEPYQDVLDAVKELREALQALEDRVSPDSDEQGIVRNEGFLSEVYRVSGSLSSSFDAPNATQLGQLERIEREAREIVDDANRLFTEEVAKVRAVWEASGLVLLADPEPVELGE